MPLVVCNYSRDFVDNIVLVEFLILKKYRIDDKSVRDHYIYQSQY